MNKIGNLNAKLQKDLIKQYRNAPTQKFPPEVFTLLPEVILKPGDHDFCDFIPLHDCCVIPLITFREVPVVAAPQHWKAKGTINLKHISCNN